MIESPLIQEMRAKTRHEAIAESTHKAILRILASRFGSVPAEVVRAVHEVADEQILDRLLDSALACIDLKAFLERLPDPGKAAKP